MLSRAFYSESKVIKSLHALPLRLRRVREKERKKEKGGGKKKTSSRLGVCVRNVSSKRAAAGVIARINDVYLQI